MIAARLISLALSVMLFLAGAAAVPAANLVYDNERFGYHVEYPDSFSQEGELPMNGDGIRLSSEDALLSFWASYNVLSQTPEEYLALCTEGEEVSSSKWGEDYCQFTKAADSSEAGTAGTDSDESVTFRYVFFASDDRLIGFQITYPAEEKKAYKKIIKSLKKSLRSNG